MHSPTQPDAPSVPAECRAGPPSPTSTNESNSSDVNAAGSSWIIDGDHLTVLFRADARELLAFNRKAIEICKYGCDQIAMMGCRPNPALPYIN